jgi:hypothetical protein
VGQFDGQNGGAVLERHLLGLAGPGVRVDECNEPHDLAAGSSQGDEPRSFADGALGDEGPRDQTLAPGAGRPRIVVGLAGAGPRREIAVAILDSHRQPCQVVNSRGDAVLAIPRDHGTASA